jgi:sulfur-carrier protein
MKMHIELYASLMSFLPPGSHRFRRDIEVADGTSVQQIIEQFNISDEQAHIVLVNGLFVCGDDRDQHTLSPGDTVAIWPPVAGG